MLNRGRRAETVVLARRRVRLPPVMADTLLTPPFVRGHDHALGESGPVLVLFGDYEDPDSAAAHQGVVALRERWDGFMYAWRHLPIGELHPSANGAALAAEGAAAQDAFWAYHHVLLARQDALSVPDLLNYAGQIGLRGVGADGGHARGRATPSACSTTCARRSARARWPRRRSSSRACAGTAAGSRTRWRARCVQPWPGEVLEERAGEIAVAFAALLTRQAAWRHRRVETITVLSHEQVRRRVSVDFTVPLEHRDEVRLSEHRVGRAAGAAGQAPARALRPVHRGRDGRAAAALRRGAADLARAAVPDARPRCRGRRSRRTSRR